jgi:predicted metal-dependent enzyme (double-stranded beta helix superfamily)
MDNENALERFVRKTRALFANEPDPEKRWASLSPVLAEFLADPAVVEASSNWPECVARDGRAENLLFYEDRDFGFAVNGLTKGPSRFGVLPRIHDHAHIYTLYGVLDGHERIERYERLDDRTKPDYAEIRQTADMHVGPGEIDLVKPYEIHREITVGESTVAIIIRSEKGGGFNQGRYDPETNRYWESLGPRQTPVDMFAPSPVVAGNSAS